MIDYIKGEISELTPACAIIETGGIGYFINISLPAYTVLFGKNEAKLYVYEVIREDAHVLFGFITQTERQLFLLLISVSGIGANTARMIMSSYSAQEIQEMIASGNSSAISTIKGIGLKTAQRIIVDLKDKILKISGGGTLMQNSFISQTNELKEEAVSALVMLGFVSTASIKAVDKVIKEQPGLKVEQVIKQALKLL
jgi:Holliday junction DNA helicase RuvA